MNEFKKRLLIKLGVFFILIAALLSIEILIGRTISKDRDDIIAKKVDREARLNSAATLLDLRKSKGEAEKAISILSNSLPNRDGVFTFKSDVERFAANRSVKANMIFGNETLGGGSTASKIEFIMSASGDFSQVMTFLKDFEDSRYFTKFRNMELSTQGGQSSVYQLVISGELLFRS